MFKHYSVWAFALAFAFPFHVNIATGEVCVRILGLSAYYHDSAAVLLEDGRIVAAAQEERFTRKKQDPAFPRNAAEFCLRCGEIGVDDLDAVVFYDKPLLKFERLLETYYAHAPEGLLQFVTAMPVWMNEKLFLKNLIRKELVHLGLKDRKGLKLLFTEHHLAHAASAFFPSPFEQAAILTIDGVGEWATASICKGDGANIDIVQEMHFPHSLGLLYSAFTYYLGFRVNSGEYKLMGLAPYGDPQSDRVTRYVTKIKDNLVRIYADGSIWLSPEYFDFETGLRMVKEPLWNSLFGFPRRTEEQDLEGHHCDLALAIQQVTEQVVLAMASTAKQLTGSANLCLAGGVALNCVANGRLLRSGEFENIWIQPAAGDAGGALGAALAVHHIGMGQARLPQASDSMQGAYLGPEYNLDHVKRTARAYDAPYQYYEDFAGLSRKVAELVNEGNIVGWFQGRMEWGPRALGNRTILADARSPEMQRRLNLKIKYREGFRPFAPVVMAESAGQYFEIDVPSPYMLLTASVPEHRRKPLPEDFDQLNWREKLYHQRSDIPAVTHIDFSARMQTVHKETNPRFWRLLSDFEELTGCAVMINTSFNVRGEPIVCNPEDAYRCFMNTEMDYLVMDDLLFDKSEQPAAAADAARQQFAPD
jgi:carbamoyltransferase